MFHLHHLAVRVRDKILDDVLLAQPVAAADGIVEVIIEIVMGQVTAAAPPSAATVWLRIG